MIDWNELIKPENTGENAQIVDKCRNREGVVGTDSALCRNDESKHSCGSTNSVPTVPTVPTQKTGDRKANEETRPGVVGSTEIFSDAKTHPVNPIAVCLLLTCCNKATVNKEETIESIWKLQFMTQAEQVRSWAILCVKNGVDPFKVIRPFEKALEKVKACKECRHISMALVPNEDTRPAYKFTCNKYHAILEAHYVGERVLVAPETCNDFEPISHQR